MIALMDDGIGNLRSMQQALEHVGTEVTRTSNPEVIVAADKVVLPGVSALGDGMKGMKARDLINPVKAVMRVGTPLLGICVGMQWFCEESEEHGHHARLGIVSGRVKRVEPDPEQKTLKVPQTGWNEIKVQTPSPLFHDLPQAAMAMRSALPNKGMQATADSVRCAPASRRA